MPATTTLHMARAYAARLCLRSVTVRLLVLGAVTLSIFALYAPSLRLMLLHDDAVILPGIVDRTVINIFENRPNDVLYRPMSYVPWLLARDAFGWFLPAALHLWNVAAHVLNTALVMALSAWLGRRLQYRGLALPALCGLIFGLFPLSYQAILWASALVHPLMTTFGMLALFTYVRAQATRARARVAWGAVSAACLLAACLCHEMGFVFGGFILLFELLRAVTVRRRPRALALILCGLAILYPLAYFALIRTPWSTLSSGSYGSSLSDKLTNALYFIQGMVLWVVIPVRPLVGLIDARPALLAAFLVAGAGAGLLLLRRLRLASFGVVALLWWVAAAAPAVLFLSEPYVRFGPRLLYVSSVGVALFWGVVTAGLLRAVRRPLWHLVLLAPVAVLCAWCVPYISERMGETARLTPAMRQIDADLRALLPDARVLYINLPWWNAPAYPSFFIGAEGMSIFQHDSAPPWTWLAGVSGTRRETDYVRHDISLTHGNLYDYGVAGRGVDDTALRREILRANDVYRFDYDAPGLRVRRLALLGHDPTTTPPLAKLSTGVAQAVLRVGRAAQCADSVVVDLAWSDVRGMDQPVGVFVHVFDQQNRQAIVADKDLVDGYLPLDQVPAGVVVSETRAIIIPSNVATVKAVWVGAYRRSDGQRFTAARADGGPWESDAVVIPIDTAGGDLCARASDWPRVPAAAQAQR
jgi:hypothetical protein